MPLMSDFYWSKKRKIVLVSSVRITRITNLLFYNLSNPQSVLNEEMVQTIIDEVTQQHMKWKTVTNQLMRKYLYRKYEMIIYWERRVGIKRS